MSIYFMLFVFIFKLILFESLHDHSLIERIFNTTLLAAVRTATAAGKQEDKITSNTMVKQNDNSNVTAGNPSWIDLLAGAFGSNE